MRPGQTNPGETPIADLSCLKIKGLRFRRELNEAEANNIAKATEKYLIARLTPKKAPFTFAWVLALHREMFGDVWTWAGVPRQENVSVGVDFQQVQPMLYALLGDLPEWQSAPWPEQAAWLHHRAVQIHPFPNGNGRWSRLLANVWLRRHRQPYTRWPDTLSGESSVVRDAYLAAVQAADQGDYEPLVALHRRFMPNP